LLKVLEIQETNPLVQAQYEQKMANTTKMQIIRLNVKNKEKGTSIAIATQKTQAY